MVLSHRHLCYYGPCPTVLEFSLHFALNASVLELLGKLETLPGCSKTGGKKGTNLPRKDFLPDTSPLVNVMK
jgi:hypothetical protein